MFILKHQNSDSLSYYGMYNQIWKWIIFIFFFIYCFIAINRGDIKDTEMDFIMDNIVDSLFSVFVTLGKTKQPVLSL